MQWLIRHKCVRNETQRWITRSLDIKEVLSHEKYLGVLTIIGRSKKKRFLFVVDRIKSWLFGWMERLVSWKGREVLIKTIAQAILTYAMSVFKFPHELCKNIHATITPGFDGGHKQDEWKIHWLSRCKLCQQKEDGGLGFYDIKVLRFLARR